MPTKQQTFDAVVEHLRRQGRKALRLSGYCAYRGADGTMCAAGCLIPNESYNATIEGYGVLKTDDLTPTDEVGDLIETLGHDVMLVGQLQRVHDKKDVLQWEDGFKAVALTHHLTYTPPEPAQ